MGFGADIRSRKDRNIGELLSLVEPEDLLRYGLIPELVGRLPVIGALDSLNKESLIEILTKPKNAIIKQYQRFFEMEGVKLEFTEDGLEAVADLALKRGTGARGLRAVLEEAMMDLMYEIPSRLEVVGCTITRDVINRKAEPILIFRGDRRRKEA
jgi:ATP-dependent Clp protease ATP-binding subunit ClpX